MGNSREMYRKATLDLAEKRMSAEFEDGLIEKMELPIVVLRKIAQGELEVDEKVVTFFDECRVLIRDSEKHLDNWMEQNNFNRSDSDV